MRFLMTANVVGLYPRIPSKVSLRELRRALKTIALKNSYFEFGNKIKQQISGTVIWTRFFRPYSP